MHLKDNHEHEETEDNVPNEEHLENDYILGPTNISVSGHVTEHLQGHLHRDPLWLLLLYYKEADRPHDVDAFKKIAVSLDGLCLLHH